MYRRIAVHRRIDYQRIGVSDSNVQHNKLVHRRIGVPATGESITGESAYQIPTFNTTDWRTGESAYTGESITILIGVSDSNVQHNKLVHRRIGVHRRIDYHHSAYQIPTFNTTNWYTGESAYTGESITIIRRIRFQRPTQQVGTPAKQRTGDRRPGTGESPYQIPTFNTTDWYTGESAYTGESITILRRIRFQRPT